MFNPALLNQLMAAPKTLQQDIIDNLAEAEKPLDNTELLHLTKTWATARDITIELQHMKRRGQVEIDSFVPGTYPARGLWRLTEKGRALVSGQVEATV